MILAVTGGRKQPVTEDELRALWSVCARHVVRVLRVGCCPTGVDAAVWAAACAFEGRMFALERWVADWSRPRNSGGPLRNRALASGDPRIVVRVEGVSGLKSRSMISRGPIGAVIVWPGNKGTASMVEESKRVDARIVSVSNLREST